MANTYRADKRITHPESFPKYFLRRTLLTELTDAEVEEAIRGWEEVELDEGVNKVYGDLRRYQDRNKLGEFILKVRVFMGRIPTERIAMVLRGACLMIPHLQPAGPGVLGADYDRLESFLLRLVEDRAEEGEIRPLIEEIVETVENLHFVVLTVLSCHRASQGSLFRISEHLDLEHLRNIAAERLRLRYIQEDRDIFSERPKHEWSLMLYQWGTDWMTNSGEHQAEVREYVGRRLDREPRYIGALLESFVEKWPRSAGVFRLADFRAFLDPEAMKVLLDKHSSGAAASTAEREAVKLFRQAMSLPVKDSS